MAIFGLEGPSAEDQVSVQVSIRWGRSHVQTPSLIVADDGNVCVADDEKSCMLLVMRTLSIVPLNFKVGSIIHCAKI